MISNWFPDSKHVESVQIKTRLQALRLIHEVSLIYSNFLLLHRNRKWRETAALIHTHSHWLFTYMHRGRSAGGARETGGNNIVWLQQHSFRDNNKQQLCGLEADEVMMLLLCCGGVTNTTCQTKLRASQTCISWKFDPPDQTESHQS